MIYYALVLWMLSDGVYVRSGDLMLLPTKGTCTEILSHAAALAKPAAVYALSCEERTDV